jgi:carboxyl-terminal processing protease
MDQNGMKYSNDPGALKVTIQKFYRPSGASTQLKGVMADIVLPSLSGVAGVGEAKMQDPLAWDIVPPADFIREDHTTPFMKELRSRSAARVAADKDFAYLRENIARFQKNLATQTVSLNEADRRQENEAAKAREDLRKKELLARGESQPKTHEITLENSDAPDLPAPIAVKEGSPETKLPIADKTENVENGVLPNDPVLRESEHIMADYVGMLHHSTTVAVAAH